MDKEKIKNKARAAMLRATILAAAGTGMAQSAAAQEKNADDNKHKIEMTASMGMDDLEGAFADFAAEAEKPCRSSSMRPPSVVHRSRTCARMRSKPIFDS